MRTVSLCIGLLMFLSSKGQAQSSVVFDLAYTQLIDAHWNKAIELCWPSDGDAVRTALLKPGLKIGAEYHRVLSETFSIGFGLHYKNYAASNSLPEKEIIPRLSQFIVGLPLTYSSRHKFFISLSPQLLAGRMRISERYPNPLGKTQTGYNGSDWSYGAELMIGIDLPVDERISVFPYLSGAYAASLNFSGFQEALCDDFHEAVDLDESPLRQFSLGMKFLMRL